MQYFREKTRSLILLLLKSKKFSNQIPILAADNYYLWSVNDECWYQIHLQTAMMNVLSPSGLRPTISQFRDGC